MENFAEEFQQNQKQINNPNSFLERVKAKNFNK